MPQYLNSQTFVEILDSDPSGTFGHFPYSTLIHWLGVSSAKGNELDVQRRELLSAMWAEASPSVTGMRSTVHPGEHGNVVVIDASSLMYPVKKALEDMFLGSPTLVHALGPSLQELLAVPVSRTQGTVKLMSGSCLVYLKEKHDGEMSCNGLGLRVWQFQSIHPDHRSTILRAKMAECPDLPLEVASALLDPSRPLGDTGMFTSEEGMIDWGFMNYQGAVFKEGVRSETSSQWKKKKALPRGRERDCQSIVGEKGARLVTSVDSSILSGLRHNSTRST